MKQAIEMLIAQNQLEQAIKQLLNSYLQFGCVATLSK